MSLRTYKVSVFNKAYLGLTSESLDLSDIDVFLGAVHTGDNINETFDDVCNMK